MACGKLCQLDVVYKYHKYSTHARTHTHTQNNHKTYHKQASTSGSSHPWKKKPAVQRVTAKL